MTLTLWPFKVYLYAIVSDKKTFPMFLIKSCAYINNATWKHHVNLKSIKKSTQLGQQRYHFPVRTRTLFRHPYDVVLTL